MNLIMKRPRSSAAHRSRRTFLGIANHQPLGDILDLDFDNDNDKPLTAEPLDWHQSRKHPQLT